MKFLLLGLLSTSAFAQVADGAAQLPAADFAAQVLQAIKSMGGVSTLVKVSVVLTLIVSSMKVSFLNQLIWSKLGSVKVFVAPALAIVVGVIEMMSGGSKLSLPMLMAYLAAGGGAVALHEILDALKSIPGIGSVWIALIDLVSSALGGPTPASASSVVDSKKNK